ncbi:hypothetical protein J7E50_05330 [Pedobacter sp. ISL-68]|uniref:hypothetical protein n=1 Tax=unclassified Pedobacter TaxID=2628915 RepID=UPI001BE52519|nr:MULTISPECIES: hypothetical protein [unclassified Pedobacter]MBT2563738.1 hypothetical protein [Pedobacter sp. ISL-64]MBT2589630.1 hypothetical protein [Pedobacter sp. ISL-68]
MEINIEKPKRKVLRKGMRSKARAAVPPNIKQKTFKQKVIHTDKTNSNKPLPSTHLDFSKLDIRNQKSIEKTDDTITSLSNEKEEKLLNLIVKVLVRATLDEIYGKESN